MSITWTRRSIPLVFGDSTNVGLGGGVVPFYTGLQQNTAAKFGGLQMPAVGFAPAIVGQQVPFFYIDAAAGRKFGDISGTIGTLINEVPSITDVLFWLGINDAAALQALTLDIPTMQGQVTTCLTAALTRVTGPHIMIVGPASHDSGDFATQIAAIDANIPALVTGIGGSYVQMSQLNWVPRTVADGTHPNYTGSIDGSQLVVNQVQVVR